MKKCEFEEKQYEGLMNHALISRSREFFPAGQFLESFIGIDAALFSVHPFLSRYFPFSRMGVFLRPDLWGLDRIIDNNYFPRFKCNLFIQYKRPNLFSRKGKEYQYWGQPYFRYEIDSNQQAILLELDRKVRDNALVVYACPAFWRARDLWQANHNSEIVEKSNYVKASKLSAVHRHYTFLREGNRGKAFSEPEDIKDIGFLEDVVRLFKESKSFDFNSKFILSLSESLEDLIPQISKIYGISYGDYMGKFYIPKENFLSIGLSKVYFVTFVLNVSWLIGCVDPVVDNVK